MSGPEKDTLIPAKSPSPDSGETGGSPNTTAENAGRRTPQSGESPAKRRAKIACHECRKRKLKCDYEIRQPCTRCTRDGDHYKCWVPDSKRQRKRLGHLGSGDGHHHLQSNRVGNGAGYAVSMPHQQNRMAGISNIANAAETHPMYRPLVPQPPGDAGGAHWNPLGNGEPFVHTPQPPQPPPPADQVHLPPFIRPIQVESWKIFALHHGKALLLPSKRLQNALLKAYVNFVHPYMPILELGHLLSMVSGREPEAKISLLLYQAVMFVAVAYVEEEFLQEEGFASKKTARKELFHKVRQLYDLDIETGRLETVQALLLMTYWYETPDDMKDTWHWMGIAISVAHTIGLNQDPAIFPQLDERKRKLHRRIWWSMFMRDRLIALGMRRPSRIEDNSFNVPMLEISDFEIEPPHLEDAFIRIPDVEVQRQLALMCMQKVKLCRLIKRVIELQYSVLARGVQADNAIDSTVMLMPKKNLDNFKSVQDLDADLSQWLEKLPECCKFQHLTEVEVSNNAPLALQRTLLHMLHRTTVAALHRPNFAQSPLVPDQIQDQARKRVIESAEQVIDMASQLHRFNLDPYLPTTGVTAILPAMIIHILEMRNPDPNKAQAARGRFQQGIKVLGELRKTYNSADFALRFLREADKRSNAVQGVLGKQTLRPHGNSNSFGMSGWMSGSMPAASSFTTTIPAQPQYVNPFTNMGETGNGYDYGDLREFNMTEADQSPPSTDSSESPIHGTMQLSFGESGVHGTQQEFGYISPHLLQHEPDRPRDPAEGANSDGDMLDLEQHHGYMQTSFAPVSLNFEASDIWDLDQTMSSLSTAGRAA